MAETGTPKGKPRLGKVAEPLDIKDYLVIKNKYPHLDWNDEDQSYTTKKGTKSYAKKLFYFRPLTPEMIAMGRAKHQENQRNQWEKFLGNLQNGMRVNSAAKSAGLSYASVKNRWYDDPDFRDRWIQAEAIAAEPVEDAMFQAATAGNVPAATKWLEERSSDRWPKPSKDIKITNTYELDATDRLGNIARLLATLESRALIAGEAILDVEAEEE